MKKIILLLLFVPACLRAYDFGVVLDQKAGLGGTGNEAGFDYAAALVPYLSVPIGDSGDLYISAGAMFNYEDKAAFFPELFRTEISWRFNKIKIKAGRIQYEDPLDFVIEGLFDGAQFFYDTPAGVFSAGTWYTGMLYKKRANILITQRDIESYYTALDYADFSGTYFASRRMLAAVGWEHPAIAGMIRMKCALSGQIDLNDTDAPFHSFYLSAKAGALFRELMLELGGCVQIAAGADESGVGFAGEFGVLWMPLWPFQSQFALHGRLSSGRTDTVRAFIPITTKPQGDILRAKLSGLSVFSLDYTARLHRSFSAGASASYFIRSDLGTFNSYPAGSFGNNKGFFLGGEFVGRLMWSPVSDLSLNMGAGVFLPSMGDTAHDAEPRWRVELSLLFAFF